MFDTIILATDITPEWEKIIDCAGEFRTLGCSQVILTHVLSEKSIPGFQVELQSEIQPKLEDQKRRLESQGLEVILETPSALPTLSLNQLAQGHGASLIVVGSHGKTILRQAVLGSFSNALLHLPQK